MERTDFLIIGGGIAGAGLAYFLRRAGTVTLIEAEDSLAYHTTGRSAAFYAETYGGPAIQPLTTASHAFLAAPPAADFDAPLLSPARGALHIFTAEQEAAGEACYHMLSAVLDRVRLLDAAALTEFLPYLAAGYQGAVLDPNCADIDVAALHQGYVAALCRAGGKVYRQCRLTAAERRTGCWQVETTGGSFAADILINAAGAWADEVAACAGLQPLGVAPLRRTVAVTGPVAGVTAGSADPLTLDVEERFYFKPEGAGFLLSPADQTPSAACDAQPEEIDIARAVDAFESATGRQVTRLTARWAGLRCFAPDRLPVIGFDPRGPGFFWNVGQGGWGIQTSPAWSALAAAQITGTSAPGLDLRLTDADRYSLARFADAA